MAAFPSIVEAPIYKDVVLNGVSGIGFGMREAAIIDKQSPYKFIGPTDANPCIKLYVYNGTRGVAAGTHLDVGFFDLDAWEKSLQRLINMTRKDPTQSVQITLIGGEEGSSEKAATKLVAFLRNLPNVSICAQLGDTHPRNSAICVEDGSITTQVQQQNLLYYPDGVTLYYKPYNFNLPQGIDLLYLGNEFHRNPPIKLEQMSNFTSRLPPVARWIIE